MRARSGAGQGAGNGGAGGVDRPPGLRERKRLQTYRHVSETAIALFLARGFDAVPVAEIAAVAGVSKPTLFRYFPTKEDLVLHRFADHEDEPARVVTEARAQRRPPVAALAAHFRTGLDRRDPVTGLNDVPAVLAYHRLLYGTPSLLARLHAYTHRSETALARALAGPPAPDTDLPPLAHRLAAAQIVAVQRVLAMENWRRIAAGATADALYPTAAHEAEEGFTGLATALGER
ncbi:TetR/AcrR family transcriptional regulator [Streptomyces sp. NPDC001255]|uniref:TetR/AcrR family transcriptional regulator n=1 Tax=unclassified Streptomyces TaxID=2593676 RepID=UPI0010101431|nr:TetR family transcriptional regulator [Streptomyces sp. GZWMJZ-114]